MAENVNTGKLVLNAILAGLWAGLAVVFGTNQAPTKALLWAGVAVAVRAAIGVLSAAFGPGVPVDQ